MRGTSLLKPSPPPPDATVDVDAGIIEDARARQRRHRALGAAAVVTALVVGLLIGFGGFGGSGGGGGRNGGGRGTGGPAHSGALPPSGSPGAHGSVLPRPTSVGFTDQYGIICTLAPANPDLSGRAGCVSSLRGRGATAAEQALLYANLGPVRVGHDYVPLAWTLALVRRDGGILRVRVDRWGPHPDLLGFARLGRLLDDEVFVETDQIAGGSPVAVYSVDRGALRQAGPTFSAGGDSADQSAVICRRAPTPRIIQETAELLGPTIYGTWRWTVTAYLWHGADLIRGARRSFTRVGLPHIDGPGAIARGCGVTGTVDG